MQIQGKRGEILQRDTAGPLAQVTEISALEDRTVTWGEGAPERLWGNYQNAGGRNVDLNLFVSTQEVTAREVGRGGPVIMLDKSRLQFSMVYSGAAVASIVAQVHERNHNADENDKFSHAGTCGRMEYSAN